MAEARRNNSTAARLTVETVSGDWYLEPVAAAECDLELQRDNWRLTWQRHAARIERYAQKTNRKRICVAELLGKGGDKHFRPLLKSLLKGEFNSNGQCRALWLHACLPPQRMTPEFMASIVKIYEAAPFTIRDQFVSRCWIPRHMAESWAKAHNIKLERKSRRGRPRGQRQDVNTNDAQYIHLVARYCAEGKSEHEAVRMALEKQQLDHEKDWIERQRGQKPRPRDEAYQKSEAIRIRKKFREGQRG
jgi:hypothetical protein